MVDSGRERMVRIVGERYADCGFSTFDVGDDKNTPKRIAARDAVREYAREIRAHREQGRNLLIVGSVGTGKDHLASAVVRMIVGTGMSVAYTRGSVLFGEIMAAMKGADLNPKYATRDFLVVSDIEPRGDKESSAFFQTSILDLIDERYRAKLPTIVTSNHETRETMGRIIGTRTLDRLIECATVVKCKWPSYRTGASNG